MIEMVDTKKKRSPSSTTVTKMMIIYSRREQSYRELHFLSGSYPIAILKKWEEKTAAQIIEPLQRQSVWRRKEREIESERMEEKKILEIFNFED